MIPRKAFILAAGLGTRLRPYTDDRPKPLVEVGGRTLLERILDQLEEAGVEEIVINSHYKADVLHRCIESRAAPRIHLSHEEILLDTGGGIKKALGYFDEPFFVLSGDGLWTDGPDQSALKRLAGHWNPDEMDILMLLQPTATMALTGHTGDYTLAGDGVAKRALDQSGDYMFTSIRINAPGIFDDSPDGVFSYLELMDRAEKLGRLYGLAHDGDWHHISTPEDLENVRTAFEETKRRA